MLTNHTSIQPQDASVARLHVPLTRLNVWHDLVQPVRRRARRERDGSLLEAVELVQRPVHRHVRDKVEGVVVLGGGLLVVGDEGLGARE